MALTICNGRTAVRGLAALLLTALPAAPQTPAAPTIVDVSRSVEATTRSVMPAVVEIFATSYRPGQGLVPRAADLVTTERASGSGVIVDPDGYIVTNAHVVAGAQRLQVEVPIPVTGTSILATRSRTMPATVVGIDAETDLAVLRVSGPGLTAAAFGDSESLRPGQLVLALGSPFGLHNSVSLGVVSAAARQLEPESPMIYVQTDAAINPGSSGGPLVDLSGRVVGINTLIFSQRGGYEGIGFAAPSNVVRTVYEQIKMFGRVRRGDIGVRAQTVTPVLAAGLNLSRDRGVVLADVLPGSSAEIAGLRAGDLVLTADGKPMENGRQFHVGLYRGAAGQVVTLDILRGTDSLRFPVALGERPDLIADLASGIDPRENLVPRLGILGVTVNPAIAQMLPGLRMKAGVVVASLADGTLDSRQGGLAAGDVVFGVNRIPVPALRDLRAAIDALKPGDPVVLHVERRGERLYLPFTLE
jgi:serine protease Do